MPRSDCLAMAVDPFVLRNAASVECRKERKGDPPRLSITATIWATPILSARSAHALGRGGDVAAGSRARLPRVAGSLVQRAAGRAGRCITEAQGDIGSLRAGPRPLALAASLPHQGAQPGNGRGTAAGVTPLPQRNSEAHLTVR